jgi:ABC-type phosphate/phosphonate transport system substrate-binding protein
MKKVFSILAVAMFATMIACGGGNSASTQATEGPLGPKETQEKFVGYVIDGKWDKAVDMLVDADKATPEQKAQFAEALKAMSQENTGGVKSYEALEEIYSKDSTSCKVKGRYTYGNGKSMETTDKLKKTENGWACTL